MSLLYSSFTLQLMWLIIYNMTLIKREKEEAALWQGDTLLIENDCFLQVIGMNDWHFEASNCDDLRQW